MVLGFRASLRRCEGFRVLDWGLGVVAIQGYIGMMGDKMETTI